MYNPGLSFSIAGEKVPILGKEGAKDNGKFVGYGVDPSVSTEIQGTVISPAYVLPDPNYMHLLIPGPYCPVDKTGQVPLAPGVEPKLNIPCPRMAYYSWLANCTWTSDMR
jgi:hypothetical protein